MTDRPPQDVGRPLSGASRSGADIGDVGGRLGAGPSSDAATQAVRQSILRVSREMEAVIDAAERAAGELRARAEAEAERSVANLRREAAEAQAVARSTASGLARIRSDLLQIEGRTRDLIAGVDALVDRIGVLRDPVAGVAAPARPPGPPEPIVDHEPADAPEASADAGRESALIRATQMVVGGIPRTEIEAVLRHEFGRDDAEAIVAEVLGP